MVPTEIAIVGSGFVGRSWAILFAAAGHPVALYDSDPDTLASVKDEIADALVQMDSCGLIDAAPADILARMRIDADLASAVSTAGYVQENVSERIELKRALFAELDRLAPADAILASSSSSLTCSRICVELSGRARCLVAHPANPPHLLRAVELAPAWFTDLAVIERAASILEGVGQVPVVIGEIDGFVMNRLQAALGREALSLVEAGIADAAAIDDIVKHSLGLRWSFMGPFETMDLNAPGGFQDYAERYGPSFAALFGEPAWPVDAVEAVVRSRRHSASLDQLDDRRRWRDQRLAALVRHLRAQDDVERPA